jgi:ATP-dependent RNA helicase DBP3
MVLDEADRMLDMGFEGDIRKIFAYELKNSSSLRYLIIFLLCFTFILIRAINKKRQVAMFSATWPLQIRALASEFLRDAVKVTIGSKELQANVKILQKVEVIEPEDRDKRLIQLLIEYKRTPVCVLFLVIVLDNDNDNHVILSYYVRIQRFLYLHYTKMKFLD